MIHRYVGMLETGQLFAAAHTLIPREQHTMGMAIDSVTARYGSNVAVPNDSGWIVRSLATEVQLEQAEAVLGSNGGEVVYMGKVTLAKMSEVLNRQDLEKAFGREAIAPTTITAEL